MAAPNDNSGDEGVAEASAINFDETTDAQVRSGLHKINAFVVHREKVFVHVPSLQKQLTTAHAVGRLRRMKRTPVNLARTWHPRNVVSRFELQTSIPKLSAARIFSSFTLSQLLYARRMALLDVWQHGDLHMHFPPSPRPIYNLRVSKPIELFEL